MTNSDKIESVYLDSNVIINVCDGHNDKLKYEVVRAANKGKVIYPFSATQVSEITKYPLTERCKSRLDFLSEISRNNYFVHSVNDYGFREENPLSVWETLNEALPNLNANKLFASMISFENMKGLRAHIGLDPVYLNNLSGKEAVEVINDAISKSISSDVDAPRSIKEILEYTKNITREQFSAQWAQMDTTEAHMTIGSDLQGVFGLLEVFGYWPDSEKVYKKGSKFDDGQHSFNGSKNDILVTADKGMKNRAQAAYSILDIETEVMFLNEYEEYISKS